MVVPTRNSERTLQGCLRSICSQDASRLEVIVVDNSSDDATQTIASDFGTHLIVAGPERSAQRNVGLENASGDVVLFVDSDMVLEPGLLREIQDRFRLDDSLAALVIPERSFGVGFWSHVKQFERSLSVGNTNVEAARAFRTEELRTMGGWDESLLGPEDWELTDRYLAGDKALGHTDRWIWHDEGRLDLPTLMRKKRYYAVDVGRYLRKNTRRRTGLFSRYASAAVLLQASRHPLLFGGTIVAKASELVGICLGVRGRIDSSKSVYDARQK